MREARRAPDGRWYIVEAEGAGVFHLGPPAWDPDALGRWPRVEFTVRSLGDGVTCPRCGAGWVLEEFDCVFGLACPEGNDLRVLVRCATCRLPHRVRVVGFMTAYPRVVALMEGWAPWTRRRRQYEGEEAALFGPTPDPA
ncbi:MAG: hypothetical protein ACYDA8_23610 [Deferrisomatales bacterium]